MKGDLTMTTIGWLIVGHFVGDYLIQTEFEALNKALGKFWNRALMAHCVKYTVSFVPVFFLMSINPLWLSVIFISHVFLDRRWPVLWWRRVFMRGSDKGIECTFWLTIVVDQIFHFFVLVLIASFQ